MICPKCKEENKKSKLYIGIGTTTTAGGMPPYYDEEGKYHYHDPNATTSNYSCSNGHNFFVSKVKECSACDYGKASEKITYREGNHIAMGNTITLNGPTLNTLTGTISTTSGTYFA